MRTCLFALAAVLSGALAASACDYNRVAVANVAVAQQAVVVPTVTTFAVPVVPVVQSQVVVVPTVVTASAVVVKQQKVFVQNRGFNGGFRGQNFGGGNNQRGIANFNVGGGRGGGNNQRGLLNLNLFGG